LLKQCQQKLLLSQYTDLAFKNKVSRSYYFVSIQTLLKQCQQKLLLCQYKDLA